MGAVVVAIALAWLVAMPLHAQTNTTLQGRVFDASGAVVPRAYVSFGSPASGFKRSVETDGEGRYQKAVGYLVNGVTTNNLTCGSLSFQPWIASIQEFSVNHANFGPPGNIVGSPTFGQITRTRLATGESGSSRQIQLAVKVAF